MKSYQFILLRYVPDGMTREFANVGVVVYSPGEFLDARFNSRITRLKALFNPMDKGHFKSMISYIERRFDAYAHIPDDDLFQGVQGLSELVRTVLPEDDSSLRWSEVSGGMATDFEAELEALFERLVCRYEQRLDHQHRDDATIWSLFRKPLREQGVAHRLVKKEISTQDYEFTFDHAWKNGKWNLYQPVSLDLATPDAIQEKGNRWLGRGVALAESSVDHKFWFLLGEPETEARKRAATKAMNLMMKIGRGQVEFVREEERISFSETLAAEIKLHIEDEG